MNAGGIGGFLQDSYFHLANLCEENYRVSVLHKRETAVDENQAVDPVNEMTGAYLGGNAEFGENLTDVEHRRFGWRRFIVSLAM